MSVRKGVVLWMWALAACAPGNAESPPPPDAGTTPKGCFRPPSDVANGAEWGVQFGTAKNEEFLDVALDARGQLYLAGYENGDVGVENVDPSGDARGVWWRVDPGVSFQYQARTLDLPGTTETIEALAFHPVTGELYFMGRTTGAFSRSTGAVADFTHRGQQDVYVAGPHGGLEDVVLFQGGTKYPQHPNRLAFDAHGALIVSGFDDVYVPTGTTYVERWEDPFVTRLTRSAEGPEWIQDWTRSFDTSFTDTLGGLAVHPVTGDIYVTGNNGGGAQRGAFVRGLDNATGMLQAPWIQSTISLDTIQAAGFLPDGNLLIAGTTFGVMGARSYGGQDVFLRLLNMNPSAGTVGAPLWTRQYGSSDADFVTDMAIDARGHILVVGETLGSVLDDDPSANKGLYDVFLMEFDESGERLAVRQWGSAGDDHPNAVAVDPCGQLFIAGYTTGDLTTPVPPYEKGARDAFLLALPPRP